MKKLLLVLCALACCACASHAQGADQEAVPAAKVADLPFKVPTGWKIEKQDGATVLTPGDVAAGSLYAVTVTMAQGEARTLDETFDAGKKEVAAIGKFTVATEPQQANSEGGWDNKFVLGTLESQGRSLVVELMAIKKGDARGVVVVLSESIETMTRYADTFATMIREMGVAMPAQIPVAAGRVDLQYVVPQGWVATQINGSPQLVKEKNEQWTKFRLSLLILPTEPLVGSVRDQFQQCWKAYVSPNFTTNIAPLPLMSRMKSGHACAFDADSGAKIKNGPDVTVALYLLAHGGRAVPVMGIYAGPDWNFDKSAEAEISQFLDTARIAGTSTQKVALFSAASVAGDWSESGTEHAHYVTSSGAYAGNATISTATYFNLGANGSYSRTLRAIGAAGNVREKDQGTWKIDDDELVLSKGGRYSLLGCGADPKGGRSLVIGNYSNARSRLKFTNPRGLFQALWLRAK